MINVSIISVLMIKCSNILVLIGSINGFSVLQYDASSIINRNIRHLLVTVKRNKKKMRSNTNLGCQLLGMNCATPTDFTFSFTGFARRGGITNKHSDGWGLTFYEGRGVRSFHDSLPAADSPIADFLTSYPIKTYNMMAHIRYATSGEVCLQNVHPFQREMWGINWCFAHNGDIPAFSKGSKKPYPKLGKNLGQDINDKIIPKFNPVGDTDSEALFCAILNALRSKFNTLPTLPLLYYSLNSLCEEVISYDSSSTILNFLLMCGERINFAYSWPGARPNSTCWNGLYYTIRQYPFSKTTLNDCDLTIDFASVTEKKDCVAVIATEPLTQNEIWHEFKRGELILFDEGLPHKRLGELQKVEFIGHGLKSDVLPSSIFMGSGI